MEGRENEASKLAEEIEEREPSAAIGIGRPSSFPNPCLTEYF